MKMKPEKTNYQILLTGDPVSVNHLWRSAVGKNGRPFTYATPEGVATKEAWQYQAKAAREEAGAKIIEAAPLTLSVRFYFKTRARRDVDNFLKAVLDCMTGIVYADDSQIHVLKAEKCYDSEDPRIEIIIKS